VIVNDLDVLRARSRPTEAHAELIVYAHTMLSRAILFQGLEPITWRHAQILQAGGDFELPKLTSRNRRDVREPFDRFALCRGLRIEALECLDHQAIVTRDVMVVNRRLAARSNVRIQTGILNGQRAITGDSALRLAHYFGTSAEFWLNLQKLYELRLVEAQAGASIRRLPKLGARNKSEGRKAVIRAT